jgi:hypothetical protein
MPRTYGTTSQRGYDAAHQRKREEWRPHVERGEVDCYAEVCLEERDGRGRWIRPGSRWDLGHTPDRSAWTGPEHERCNRSEGARRGNQQRGQLRPRVEPEPVGTRNRWVL